MVSLINKSLLLIIALGVSIQAQTLCIIDPEASHSEQLQQAINALNYLREENKDVAACLQELSEQTDQAFESGSLSKIIDIIIQALIYATSRLKNYDENFIDYVRGVKKEMENNGELCFVGTSASDSQIV